MVSKRSRVPVEDHVGCVQLAEGFAVAVDDFAVGAGDVCVRAGAGVASVGEVASVVGALLVGDAIGDGTLLHERW